MSYVVGKVPRQGDVLQKRSVVVGGLPIPQPAVSVQPSVGVFSYVGTAPAGTTRRSTPSIGQHVFTGITGKGQQRAAATVRSFSFQGQPATTRIRVPPVSVASFSFSGLNAFGPVYVPVSIGVFTWSGLAPTIRCRVAPSVCSFSFTGIAPTKLRRRATPSVGVFNFFGIPLTPQGLVATPTIGVFSWSGVTVAKLRLHNRPSFATFTFSGPVPQSKRRATPSVASYSFSGLAVTKLRWRNTASLGAFSFSPLAPNLLRRATPAVRTWTFSGLVPTTKIVRLHQPPVAIIIFTGQDGFIPSMGQWEPETCTVQIWTPEVVGTLASPAEAPVTIAFVPKEIVR